MLGNIVCGLSGHWLEKCCMNAEISMISNVLNTEFMLFYSINTSIQVCIVLYCINQNAIALITIIFLYISRKVSISDRSEFDCDIYIQKIYHSLAQVPSELILKTN